MYQLPTSIEINGVEQPHSYQEFISKCAELNPEIYEVHHIEPISIGGVDLELNRIKLSPENHYMAHKLLALEHPYNSKLWYAWWYVASTHKDCCNEADYTLLKAMYTYFRSAPDEEMHRRRSEAAKQRYQNMSPEEREKWKQKISESNKGKTYHRSDEYRAKLSESKKKQYQEHPELKEQLSKTMKGRKGHPHTEEFKKSVSERSKGAKWYTNGTKNIMIQGECPDGYWPGITQGLKSK